LPERKEDAEEAEVRLRRGGAGMLRQPPKRGNQRPLRRLCGMAVIREE